MAGFGVQFFVMAHPTLMGGMGRCQKTCPFFVELCPSLKPGVPPGPHDPGHFSLNTLQVMPTFCTFHGSSWLVW